VRRLGVRRPGVRRGGIMRILLSRLRRVRIELRRLLVARPTNTIRFGTTVLNNASECWAGQSQKSNSSLNHLEG
jgi:hypothetical protein